MAVSGAAFAQSTATISGGINVGVIDTGAAGAKAGVASLGGGANAVNIITSEDLGGGLKGGFTAQMRFNAATGDTGSASGGTVTDFPNNALFHAANVHISGGFGTVRVGKIAEASNCAFDPWGCTGGAALQAGVGVGASGFGLVAAGTNANSISYASPSISGFSFGYQTTMTARTNERTVLNIGYSAGPIAVGLVSTASEGQNGGSGAVAVPTIGDKSSAMTIGASYDFGMAKVSFTNSVTKNAAKVELFDINSLGLTVPMGAVTILAGYNKDSKAAATADTKVSLGMNYALSKRTTLGADLFKAEAVNAGTGFVARVRHTF